MRRLFWGGVHPPEAKEMASAAQVTVLPAPAQVVVPLSQHIGAPAQPLVAVGDQVKMGQKIGDGEGLCVPVHAPVSGRVIAIEDRPHPGGVRRAVVIENDFQDTAETALTPHPDGEELSPEEIRSIVREAGITGMGGAAFPTAVKAQVEPGQVDLLIVNACECEPYITADDALLRAHPGRVIDGARLLGTAVGARQVVLAVEDKRFYNHPGIDPIAIGRALVHVIQAGSYVEGGSTITQQLARNFYFTQDKLFTRKVAELFVAFDIEEQYSKNEILELYMNIIYFGNNCYGIKEAAEFYYNKQPSELTLEESTYLAGLPQAPSVYSQDDVKGQQRQKQVTDAMVKYHYLTQEEADEITG